MRKNIKILSLCYLKYNFLEGKKYIFYVLKSTKCENTEKNIDDNDVEEETE